MRRRSEVPMTVIDLFSDSTIMLMFVGFLTGLSTTLGAAAAQLLLKWLRKTQPKLSPSLQDAQAKDAQSHSVEFHCAKCDLSLKDETAYRLHMMAVHGPLSSGGVAP